MKKKQTLYLAAAALILLLAACAPGTTTGPAATNSPAAQATPGAAVGDYDDFLAALRAAGAAVEEAGEIDEPIFPVTGRIIRVNQVEVNVFEFASEQDRAAAAAAISQAGYAIGTAIYEWIDRPSFWATGRLIVLYVGQDQATLELLNSVLGQPLVTVGPTPAVDDLPPAVMAGLKALAAELAVVVDDVEVVAFEQTDWPDGCLGLGGPNEGCLTVIVPGWRIQVRIGEQEYEVRTNRDGSVVRWQEVS